MNNLQVITNDTELEPLSANDIRAQVNLIQQVMGSVMKANTHYGTIPGCGDKNTLLKPGAEKIMATFRLAADPEVEDVSTSDEIRYRVKVRLTSPSGIFVGAGVGECSTGEAKYKWRFAVCDEEFEETDANRRREMWKKGWNGNPNYKIKQVRTDPSDLSNTVLKMAKKRALVDAVLTATAASDIFTQDIEDMPEELRNMADDSPRTQKQTYEEAGPTAPKELTDKLEAAAKKGMNDLLKEWQGFSDKDRKAVGGDFGRIKKMAAQ